MAAAATPPFQTVGKDKLNGLLKDLELSQKEFAELLAPGIHESMLSRWLRGLSRPDQEKQELLELFTRKRITCSDWVTDEEHRVAVGCARQGDLRLQALGKKMRASTAKKKRKGAR